MPRALIAIAAALLLALSACGSDDSGGTAADDPDPTAGDENGATTIDDPYVQIVADQMRDDPDAPFADEQIDCIAIEVVDALGGPEIFADAGLSPEEIENETGREGLLAEVGLEPTDEEILAAGAAFGNCGVTIIDMMGDDADELSPEAQDCLVDAVDDEVMGEVFLAMEQDGDDDRVDGIVMEAIAPCMPFLMD